MARRYEYFVLPPFEYRLLTAAALTAGGAIDCPEGTRGLLVGTAGAQHTSMAGGTTQDALPLQQGINPGFFTQLRVDAGNTAADIWAIL